MTTEIEHWQTVQGMLRGYRAAQVLVTCSQLGLFRKLATGPKTAAALADEADTDPQALRRLLDAAVALKLVTKTGETYANAPLAQTCLTEDGPYHLGHLVRREGAFYQRWSYLPAAVRTGRRPEANIHDEEQANWVLDFELALYDLARAAGPAVAEALSLPEDRPLRILDVGGGHGGYSMALVRRYPKSQATVFELPAAAEIASELIVKEGLSGRVSIQIGDFQQDNLGAGFDLILLFGVLVSETAEGKLALLKKAYDALKPGGQVAIRGFWLDQDRTSPADATLFSLHMLLSTEAGDISTHAEMQSWLAETGFEQSRQVDLPAWFGSSLYVADKPV